MNDPYLKSIHFHNEVFVVGLFGLSTCRVKPKVKPVFKVKYW